LRLRIDDERVVDFGFQGSGCAICMASASTMGEAIKGKTRDEVHSLFHHFIGMVVEGKKDEAANLPPKLGVFSGVTEFPIRVKCATLAWHTLEVALAGKDGTSTE
jgi:nitrogen fixation NifU-like protein